MKEQIERMKDLMSLNENKQTYDYGFKNHNTVRHRLNSNNFPEWKYIN